MSEKDALRRELAAATAELHEWASRADIMERLARLEHDQWMHWAQAVMPEVSEERRRRWQRYMVPYDELPEEIREEYRRWARRVLDTLREASIL